MNGIQNKRLDIDVANAKLASITCSKDENRSS